MDRARTITNKKLKIIEKAIGRVYRMHPALIAIKREYAEYMEMVGKKTSEAYKAFVNEKDIKYKAELKKVYSDQLSDLTIRSKEYKKLIDKFTDVMARVNQDVLDIINEEMIPIYTINYNQVAVECKKVGITVNGKENS